MWNCLYFIPQKTQGYSIFPCKFTKNRSRKNNPLSFPSLFGRQSYDLRVWFTDRLAGRLRGGGVVQGSLLSLVWMLGPNAPNDPADNYCTVHTKHTLSLASTMTTDRPLFQGTTTALVYVQPPIKAFLLLCGHSPFHSPLWLSHADPTACGSAPIIWKIQIYRQEVIHGICHSVQRQIWYWQ